MDSSQRAIATPTRLNPSKHALESVCVQSVEIFILAFFMFLTIDHEHAIHRPLETAVFRRMLLSGVFGAIVKPSKDISRLMGQLGEYNYPNDLHANEFFSLFTEDRHQCVHRESP